MTSITPEQIAEIKARTEKATPGPWIEVSHGNTVKSHGVDSLTGNVCSAISPRTQNAAFIAHARQDIPDLLAEVERLTGVLRTISTYSTYDAQDLRDIAHNAIKDT